MQFYRYQVAASNRGPCLDGSILLKCLINLSVFPHVKMHASSVLALLLRLFLIVGQCVFDKLITLKTGFHYFDVFNVSLSI